VGEKVIV